MEVEHRDTEIQSEIDLKRIKPLYLCVSVFKYEFFIISFRILYCKGRVLYLIVQAFCAVGMRIV